MGLPQKRNAILCDGVRAAKERPMLRVRPYLSELEHQHEHGKMKGTISTRGAERNRCSSESPCPRHSRYSPARRKRLQKNAKQMSHIGRFR